MHTPDAQLVPCMARNGMCTIHTAARAPLRPLHCPSNALYQLAPISSTSAPLQIKDVPAVSDGVLLGLTGHRRLGELGVLHCEVGAGGCGLAREVVHAGGGAMLAALQGWRQ